MLEAFSEICGFNQRGSAIVFGKSHCSLKRNLKKYKKFELVKVQDQAMLGVCCTLCYILYCTLSMYVLCGLPG